MDAARLEIGDKLELSDSESTLTSAAENTKTTDDNK